MISKKWLLAVGSSAVLAFGVAACGSDDGGDSTSSGSGGDSASGLSGSITIDGSSTVQPFAEAAAELFNQDNSGRRHHRRRRRHQRGLREVLRRRDRHLGRLAADRARGGRRVQEGRRLLQRLPGRQRRDLGGHQPVLWNQLPVDRTARSSCGPTTTVTNYSQLGNDADTGQPLPDAEVSLYGPGTDSGTFDYFTDAINGEEDLSRKDYQPSEDDNVLVQGVSGDQNGLGYFGFSYYEQNQDALNLVSVDDGKGCVAPSPETIQVGSSTRRSRGRCSCTRPPTRSQRPEVAAFVQYVADNYDQIAESALIVPMDDQQAQDAQADVQKAVG